MNVRDAITFVTNTNVSYFTIYSEPDRGVKSYSSFQAVMPSGALVQMVNAFYLMPYVFMQALV